MVYVEINPGVCQMIARVTAESPDQQHVSLVITSECANIRALAGRLDTVDGFVEITRGFEGDIHRAVRESLKGCCSGCTVPSGVFKAMQVAAGLALPVDARIEFKALPSGTTP